MNKLWRLKLIAFAIHLQFSAIIIGTFMFIVTQHWFPDILFELENVWEGLQILIPVDAILGPILTLILFVPGKKGLKGDLIMVAAFQILALFYGGFTIYSQRPEVMVFAGDRFEIIPSSKFESTKLAAEYFTEAERPYPFIVYSLPAQTAEQQNEFVLGNIQYQKMPDRYRPLNDYRSEIAKKALSLSKFVPANDKSVQILENFKTQYREDEVLLFVLEGTTTYAKILVLGSSNLKPIGYLDLDPWAEYKP